MSSSPDEQALHRAIDDAHRLEDLGEPFMTDETAEQISAEHDHEQDVESAVADFEHDVQRATEAIQNVRIEIESPVIEQQDIPVYGNSPAQTMWQRINADYGAVRFEARPLQPIFQNPGIGQAEPAAPDTGSLQHEGAYPFDQPRPTAPFANYPQPQYQSYQPGSVWQNVNQHDWQTDSANLSARIDELNEQLQANASYNTSRLSLLNDALDRIATLEDQLEGCNRVMRQVVDSVGDLGSRVAALEKEVWGR